MSRAMSPTSDEFRIAYYKKITDPDVQQQMLHQAYVALTNAHPKELLLRQQQLDGMKKAWGK